METVSQTKPRSNATSRQHLHRNKIQNRRQMDLATMLHTCAKHLLMSNYLRIHSLCCHIRNPHKAFECHNNLQKEVLCKIQEFMN